MSVSGVSSAGNELVIQMFQNQGVKRNQSVDEGQGLLQRKSEVADATLQQTVQLQEASIEQARRNQALLKGVNVDSYA